MAEQTVPKSPINNKKLPKSFSFSLDRKNIIISGLLLAIIVMMLVWKPWSPSTISDRTVSVTGEVTLKSEPDEFVFYPTYEFSHQDADIALGRLTDKSEQVLSELKKLGVEESKIKTNSSGYDDKPYYPAETGGDETTYSLQIQATVNDRELAQKVQNYLISTAPTGSVSPQAVFSETKRKELESQARDQAAKDARTKADRDATNLGFEIVKLKSLEDGSGFGGVMPYYSGVATDTMEGSGREQHLGVQPGENELFYSVKVVYYIN